MKFQISERILGNLTVSYQKTNQKTNQQTNQKIQTNKPTNPSLFNTKGNPSVFSPRLHARSLWGTRCGQTVAAGSLGLWGHRRILRAVGMDMWATKKKTSYFLFYWLFYSDPYTGLLKSLYNWVV